MSTIVSSGPDFDGTLLGRFGGERPPAAPWFQAAIAQAPERGFFTVDGASIELVAAIREGLPKLA